MSWHWKSDLRLTEDKSDGWTPYEAAQCTKIEAAFQKGQKTMTLDETYKIDFTEMIQHRKDDKNRQRPIKRLDDDKGNPKKRKEPTPAVAPVVAKKGAAAPKKPADPAPPPAKKAKVAAATAKAKPPKKASSSSKAQRTALKLPGGSFECTSGKLLWGQLHTVLEGHENRGKFDSRAGPIGTLTGGTIYQGVFVYCLAARQGRWNIKRVFLDGTHVGFIAHHEDTDALELMIRAKTVGFGGGDPHREIIHVNRYDWSYHHGDGAEIISRHLGNNDDEDGDQEEFALEMTGQRFMLVDGDQFNQMKTCLTPLCKKGDAQTGKCFAMGDFGVHLSMSETEYELGWIFYSGQKHATHTKADEAIAFFYDGSYSFEYLCEEGNPEVTVE